MTEKRIRIAAAIILSVLFVLLIFCAMLIKGCGGFRRRGLYSAQVAADCLEAHRSKLDDAAEYMRENPDVQYVFRGKDNGKYYPELVSRQIGNYNVLSKSDISDEQVEEIKRRVLPAFNDVRLMTVTRRDADFAEYVMFVYSFGRRDREYYWLCKELSRSGDGELSELALFVEQNDLGSGWYSARRF